MPSPDGIDYEFTGVAPGGTITPAGLRDGYDFHMVRGAADFYLIGRNRDGRRTALSDLIESMSFDESLEEVVTSGKLVLDNSIDVHGRRISKFIGKGSELILMVRNPVTGRIEERDRFVVWNRNKSTSGLLDLTFYDHFRYLAQSKITVLYTKGKRKTHWDARQMTIDLCKRYGIRLARMPRKALLDIPYFYQENEPILDILIRIWTMEAKKSKRRFVFKMVRGRLHILTKAKKPKSKVLELANDINDSGILSSMSASDGLDDIATVVRLWGTGKDFEEGTPDTRRAVVKSKQYASRKGVATWGRIYLEKPMQGITTQAEIDKEARAELKRMTKSSLEIDCEIVGFPYLRAGHAIRVRETISGTVGLFWFKTLAHSIDGDGNYKARGRLTKYEYTKTLATEPEDLKPDAVEASGGSGDVAGKTNAIPADVWRVLVAAAPKAGVPADWANSKALEQLLQHESNFDWTADNPSSTAYGLFQFLSSTWAGYGVTLAQATPGYSVNGKVMVEIDGVMIHIWRYNMCVAGLRYIKQRYGTPEKAWAFWQRQSPHWY